jgi:hypothetical protein
VWNAKNSSRSTVARMSSGPVREASRQTIRSRVIGNHLKGKWSGLG